MACADGPFPLPLYVMPLLVVVTVGPIPLPFYSDQGRGVGGVTRVIQETPPPRILFFLRCGRWHRCQVQCSPRSSGCVINRPGSERHCEYYLAWDAYMWVYQRGALDVGLSVPPSGDWLHQKFRRQSADGEKEGDDEGEKGRKGNTYFYE